MVRIFNPTKKTSSSLLSWTGNTTPNYFLSNGDEEEVKEISNKIELSPFEVITIKIKEK